MTSRWSFHCFPILILNGKLGIILAIKQAEFIKRNWMQIDNKIFKLDTGYIKVYMPILKESIEKQ